MESITLPPRVLDLTGQTFGKLTAIKFLRVREGKKKGAIWLWKCEDCGNEIEYPADKVKHQAKYHRTCACQFKIKKHFGLDSVANNVFVRSYSDGDLTFEEFYEMSQQDCYYCGDPPDNRYSRKNNESLVFVYNGLDRVDNNLPHNKSNCVPCCFNCNWWKNNKTQQQFYSRVEKVYKNRVEKNCRNA